MIKDLCSHVTCKLNKTIPFSDNDAEKVLYSLTAIVSDFSKLIVFFILFFLIGQLNLFLVSFVYTTILRIVIGGLHFKSFWGCFIFSLFYYFTIITLYLLDVNTSLINILYICSLIPIILLTPMVTIQRDAARKLNKNIYKISGFIIYSLYFIIFNSTQNTLSQIGLWVVILQSLQLLTIKGVNLYEDLTKTKDSTKYL